MFAGLQLDDVCAYFGHYRFDSINVLIFCISFIRSTRAVCTRRCQSHNAVRPGNDAESAVRRGAVAQSARAARQVPRLVGGKRGQSGGGRSEAVPAAAGVVQGDLCGIGAGAAGRFG